MSTSAEAQIVYSNIFDGGAITLNGTSPTVAKNIAGGSGSAHWICTLTNGVDGTILADGTVATNAGCALLPFTPRAGCIYLMTASLTVPAGMGNWVAMGFSQNAGQTNNPGYARFTDTPNGYAWSSARTGSNDQLFGGPKTQVGATPLINALPGAGTYTLEIVLNTLGIKWTAAAYVNGIVTGTNVIGGTQIGTNIVYGTTPNIGFAGIGQTTFANLSTTGIQWNYWSLSVTQVPNLTNSYWVAPTAIGSGDGSSAANAASYRTASFWTGVQSQLNGVQVIVNFVNGTYNAGNLVLADMGDPLHRLTLQAANRYGAILSPSSNDILELTGTQNIGLDGFVFTGKTPYWGILCQPDIWQPTRNLGISNCKFQDLTNAYYGAIGLLNGTRDVTFNNCTFTNLGYGTSGTAHFIYGSHDIVGVQVLNSSFADCRADYVRFRDDSEYCTISNCTFLSTISATTFPFITSPLFNSIDPGPGDEFFGTYFQITSNSFAYNVSAGIRAALQFSDTGYDPQGYDCALTPTQASQLSNGSTSFKQSFLQTNLGIIASGIKMFGNTFNSRVSYHVAYTYNYSSSATGAPQNGWTGTIDISDVPDASGALLASPMLRNADFDRIGLLKMPVDSSTPNECLFRTWLCNPKYASILWHPGFNGTSNAMLFNKTGSQSIYQWIGHPATQWTMDCLFAIGSGFTGSGVKFKIDLFHNDITGGKISVGVDNLGRFGIYNGGSFTVLPQLGMVTFSVDNNGNSYYNDPGDTLNVYRLRLVGDYSSDTPQLNIYASDANSMELNHQVLGLTDWVNDAPVSGQSTPSTVAFYNYTAPVVLDQVAFSAGLGEQPPIIQQISTSGSNFIFSGTNGFPGDTYYLMSSTNLTSGLWTMKATNIMDTNGNFSVTNSILPGTLQQFYRLQLQ
ncbi:MAG TPA: hypothetical protein VGO57_05155 [Verrucomicrobiae bacterium]